MKSRKRKEHCCCSLLLNAINFDDAAFVCVIRKLKRIETEDDSKSKQKHTQATY